jgi:hypothetical protein
MGLSWVPFGVVWADLSDGLVAYYPFNGNANDESGNGNHGISKGGLVYVNGVSGQAGKFDGTNTYVDIGDKVDAMGNSITVSAWVKTNNYNQYAKIVNKGQTNAGTPKNSGYSLRFVPPDYTQSGEYELWFGFYDDNDVSAYASLPVSKLPIGQFFLVTGVLNRQGSNSILELYVNGKLVSNDTAKFTSSNTNIPLAIGALHRASFGSTSEIFDGLIDEIRIYNRAISAEEIQQLYQMDNQPDPPSDDCWAIYENGNLHIPCIKVMGPFGDELHYKADMQYEPLSEPMSFQVTGAKAK